MAANTCDDIHEVKETLVIKTFYPGHSKRTVSPTFKKTKKYLIEDKQECCYICGCRENLEVHHFLIEWAMQNAVDWNKLRELQPDFDWGTFEKPEDFIDSAFNAMVLCRKHHREKNHGIHEMPYPLWIIQKYVKMDFDLDASDGLFDAKKEA